MQLVEAGKLDLDADVNRYLDFNIPATRASRSPCARLMTHTAGFEERDEAGGSPAPAVPRSRAYVKSYVPARIFAPGTTPAYSNYGAALAGYIVQRVSGEPFDDYMERHIFGPLGMHHSTFREPLPATLAADMSKGIRSPRSRRSRSR